MKPSDDKPQGFEVSQERLLEAINGGGRFELADFRPEEIEATLRLALSALRSSAAENKPVAWLYHARSPYVSMTAPMPDSLPTTPLYAALSARVENLEAVGIFVQRDGKWIEIEDRDMDNEADACFLYREVPSGYVHGVSK